MEQRLSLSSANPHNERGLKNGTVNVYADAGLFATDVVAKMLAQSRFANSDRSELNVIFTQIVLHHFLGKNTCDELFASKRLVKRFENARDFLRMDKRTDTTRVRVSRSSRFFWLAEALVNLQFSEGVDRVIEEIRTGNLQSAWEELQCAAHIVQSGPRVRFLRPSQVVGEKTPDLSLTLCGRSIYFEVEGKSERTAPTPKSISQTLDHARKQLPPNVPGVIYVRVPEGWTGKDFLDAAIAPLERFFANTSRVVAIMLRTENYFEEPEDCDIRALTVVVENPNSTLRDAFVTEVLRVLKGPVQQWMPFESLVDRVKDQMDGFATA